MNILLTGASGQLGQCLQLAFPDDWSIFAFSSKELDITDENKVNKIVQDVKPHVIINAAAYTAVDKAEDEIDLAFAINEKGIANLAIAAKNHSKGPHTIKLIHISTDYVFDGNAKEPYTETVPTNPQSIYGQSKLAGEQIIAGILDDFIIIRTAWVFSEFGQNFFLTMKRLFSQRDELSIVSDQIGNPTYAGDLANAIIESITKAIPAGIYHYSGDTSVSWFEFAKYILAHSPLDTQQRVVLSSILSHQYPQKAKRPSYSVLSCDKFTRLGILPSNWRAAVEKLSRI